MAPPPRHDAFFFFAISFRKSLPLTFRRSSAALSPQASPPLSLCAVIRNFSSLIIASHFSPSTRRKRVGVSFSFVGVSLTFCGAAFGEVFGNFFGDFTAAIFGEDFVFISGLAGATFFAFFAGGASSGISGSAMLSSTRARFFFFFGSGGFASRKSSYI